MDSDDSDNRQTRPIALLLVHVRGAIIATGICYKADPSHNKIFSFLIHGGSVKTLQPRMQEKGFFLEYQLSKKCQLPKYQLPKMSTPKMSTPKIDQIYKLAYNYE